MLNCSMKEYLPDILATKIIDWRGSGIGVYVKKCYCGNTFYPKSRKAKFCCTNCRGRFFYLKKINKIGNDDPSMPDTSTPEISFPVENQAVLKAEIPLPVDNQPDNQPDLNTQNGKKPLTMLEFFYPVD